MIEISTERRLLQGAILVAGCVPVLAGLAGVVTGTEFIGRGGGGIGASASASVPVESHVRYLSGLLLGIGLAFWAAVPRIEAHGRRVRLLAGIVVAGGLARLLGIVIDGPADIPMTAALAMELVVTPALALWQGRVARLWGPVVAATRVSRPRDRASSAPTRSREARSAR
ncbi:DUF4345 domain-containing protein [Salinarimonas ramus]|uniref:DUF4345 domain-containing protein n=1 Tax=Salinarimonas ramus TaxID=690164 RepID=UPI0027E3EC45|nr:DUF4345 domain-containing protein [Salinarimonas ramus]